MAAIAHGCGSSRQPNGTMSSSHHPNNLQHHNAIFMYANVAKYTRSSSQPTATPNNHHMYAGHQYKKPSPLPHCVSYLPLSAAGQTQTPTQFSASQRPLSAAAPSGGDSGRNFLTHSSGSSLMYRSIRHSNRKSAVELLAESKPFYVKSDAFIERLKPSNYRSNASTTTIGCGSKRGRNSLEGVANERYNAPYSGACLQNDLDRGYMATSPLHHGNSGGPRVQHQHFHHHHNHNLSGRCSSTASSSNLLQSKLRKLLSSEVAQDICSPRFKERYREDLPSQFEFPNQIPGVGCAQEQSTPAILLTQSFLSPQSLPLQPDAFDGLSHFGIENSAEGPLVLTDDYRAISPPAEYAADSSRTSHKEHRSRYNYQRSYSHSHEMTAEEHKGISTATFNINSHKSLPDLHSQISRHSPHSEILSCCSRGNRSIKSIGESSLNRDSGGSSGHYTHRSEPCYKQRECVRDAYENKVMCTSICSDYRRDSGSSTQHSANSCCGYPSSSSYRNIDCPECRAKNSVTRMDSCDYLVDFTTPEVPEAFQDDYSPPSPSVTKYRHIGEKRYSNTSSHQQQSAHIAHVYHQQISKQAQNGMLQSPGSAPSLEDLSPPPIQFKRQKCIRFKNRPRISVPNLQTGNESNGPAAAEGYRRSVIERPTFFFPKSITPEMRSKSEQISRRNSYQACNEPSTARQSDYAVDLEKFFDRLGLNDDKFHEIYSLPKRRHSAETNSDESSTVFFSDVSTVDSMRLPDSTETQPQATQAYRTAEPPSIVERNARIIKWLCNCRKMQYT